MQDLITKLNANEVTVEDLEKFKQQTIEQTLRAIPKVIEYLMKQTATMQKMSTDFFNRNAKFAEHKDLIAKLIEQTEAENPGLGYDKLLNKVEAKAHKRLQTLGNIRDTKQTVKELDKSLGEL